MMFINFMVFLRGFLSVFCRGFLPLRRICREVRRWLGFADKAGFGLCRIGGMLGSDCLCSRLGGLWSVTTILGSGIS